ncbi:hypothetical protein GCM10027402_12340 [Arthrobacter monumenti]
MAEIIVSAGSVWIVQFVISKGTAWTVNIAATTNPDVGLAVSFHNGRGVSGSPSPRNIRTKMATIANVSARTVTIPTAAPAISVTATPKKMLNIHPKTR